MRCDECCYLIQNIISNQFTPQPKIRKCEISVQELIKRLFRSSAFILH